MEKARNSETGFNITLSNHYKYVKKLDTILVCRHFRERNHVFNKHAKFIIIDKLTNTPKSKDILCQRLIERKKILDSNAAHATPKRTESRT